MIAVAADVADVASVEAMVARTNAELGRVTILVNMLGWLGGARWTPTTGTRSRVCVT